MLDDAAATVASCMDASGLPPEGGVPLLVYNPLAFARQDVVEACVSLVGASTVQVLGPDGTHAGPKTRVTNSREQGERSGIPWPPSGSLC